MQNVPIQDTFRPPPPVPNVKEGYLWKQSTSFSKGWQKRRFFIRQKGLYYYSSERATNGEVKVKQILACDLIKSTVKELPQDDRLFGFQVCTPSQMFYTFKVIENINTILLLLVSIS
jgi:hypothetical protein